MAPVAVPLLPKPAPLSLNPKEHGNMINPSHPNVPTQGTSPIFSTRPGFFNAPSPSPSWHCRHQWPQSLPLCCHEPAPLSLNPKAHAHRINPLFFQCNHTGKAERSPPPPFLLPPFRAPGLINTPPLPLTEQALSPPMVPAAAPLLLQKQRPPPIGCQEGRTPRLQT